MVTWTNWSGTYSCAPTFVTSVSTEGEIIRLVKEAASAGKVVRVAGSGHSFTDAVCTDGYLVSLENHDRVLEIDHDEGLVTVEAGITIDSLNEVLWQNGLAMANLGDIGYQSIAGAISTATHGTGARLGNLATQIEGIRLVLGDGSVVDCSPSEQRDVFKAAQVSVGALGVITQVKIRCAPAFTLDARTEPRSLDGVLSELDNLIQDNDHFEFFWFPHTDIAQVKINNRADRAPAPRSRLETWFESVFLENYAFGVACRLGRMRPSWIPALSRALTKGMSPSHVVDRSYRVFTNPRLVRFAEMEYAIDRGSCTEALQKIRQLIADEGFMINFPVEVRFVASDDIPLSPSFGRDTCYIAVHTYQGMDYRPYFEGVEAIMEPLGGRPHWGKLHFLSADELAPKYPLWGDFQATRKRLDPQGVFENAYIKRTIGTTALSG